MKWRRSCAVSFNAADFGMNTVRRSSRLQWRALARRRCTEASADHETTRGRQNCLAAAQRANSRGHRQRLWHSYWGDGWSAQLPGCLYCGVCFRNMCGRLGALGNAGVELYWLRARMVIGMAMFLTIIPSLRYVAFGEVAGLLGLVFIFFAARWLLNSFVSSRVQPAA